ncbi:hypothetical protein G6F65_020031 [Rhizopus arrhizus]|nr:hypothetical protein G6F65_020031 [Rhizopus arrhizus]
MRRGDARGRQHQGSRQAEPGIAQRAAVGAALQHSHGFGRERGKGGQAAHEAAPAPAPPDTPPPGSRRTCPTARIRRSATG